MYKYKDNWTEKKTIKVKMPLWSLWSNCTIKVIKKKEERWLSHFKHQVELFYLQIGMMWKIKIIKEKTDQQHLKDRNG